jgi:hypothetical protein
MVTREHIVSEIRRLAEANGGKPLGRERFRDETGIREADWLGRYWARWSDAVTEAGLTPNTLQSKFDDQEALRLLALEVRRLGHLPTHAEMRLRRREDATFPNDGVFARLGKKAALAQLLHDYCGEHPEFSDVAEMIAPDDATSSVGQPEESGMGEIGYVYLVKSGRHYKIGRSNSVGRREYELAIQLPVRAELIHKLATDDPVGIERYWHQRFAEKRANGEWFDLTPQDVSAFRRRRSFM